MNIGRVYLVAVIAANFLGTVTSVQAAVIETEGVAAINAAGIGYARQLAMQDAINQASVQIGVEVRSKSRVDSQGVALESSYVRPTVRISNVKILYEWEVDDNFHVRISTDTQQSEPISTISHQYRKKIAATPFFARKQYQVNDIDDISLGFPRELLRRLESKNGFLVRSSREGIATDSTGLNSNYNSIIRIAAQYDCQFVISGEIMDASNSSNNKRWFEIEFVIYDGLTGSMIARHRLNEAAEGEVNIGHEKTFASKSFLSTAYGQAISKTIDAAAELISTDLEHLPFTAKVVRVADGQVYVNVGGTSLIAPGDQLVVYRKETKFWTSGFGSNHEYGVTETPVSTLSIVQVQPMFSIGTLFPNGNNVTVEAGDVVRFDFTGQTQH